MDNIVATYLVRITLRETEPIDAGVVPPTLETLENAIERAIEDSFQFTATAHAERTDS